MREGFFLKNGELKVSRRRKVMKVKTREGTERNSCSSIAANKDTARLTEEEEQTALSKNPTVVLTNVCHVEEFHHTGW